MKTFRAVFYDRNGIPLHKGHEWFPLGRCSVPDDSSAAEKLHSAAESRLRELWWTIAPEYWQHLLKRIPEKSAYAIVDDHGSNSALVVL